MTVNLELPANWRSTASAAVTAFFSFVLLHPHYFPAWLQDAAGYAAIGGLIAFGVTAKDASNSAADELAKALKPAPAPLRITPLAAAPVEPSPELIKTILEAVAQQQVKPS